MVAPRSRCLQGCCRVAAHRAATLVQHLEQSHGILGHAALAGQAEAQAGAVGRAWLARHCAHDGARRGALVCSCGEVGWIWAPRHQVAQDAIGSPGPAPGNSSTDPVLSSARLVRLRVATALRGRVSCPPSAAADGASRIRQQGSIATLLLLTTAPMLQLRATLGFVLPRWPPPWRARPCIIILTVAVTWHAR